MLTVTLSEKKWLNKRLDKKTPYPLDFNKRFEWGYRLTGHTCYIRLMYEILHQLIGIWVRDFQRLEHLSLQRLSAINSVVGFVELVLCSLKFVVNVFFLNDIFCNS